MNDFAQKVRAAAVAGWWSLLIGYVLLTIIWLVYLGIISARPTWLMDLWGKGISWDFMQVLSLWFLGIFKLFLWLMLIVVIWLTLWARQLRKMGRQSTT
jgi:hypothetical protein